MEKVLVGVFVGVFVGALAYEILRKSEIARITGRKVSESLQSARIAFEDGYRASRVQPLPNATSTGQA